MPIKNKIISRLLQIQFFLLSLFVFQFFTTCSKIEINLTHSNLKIQINHLYNHQPIVFDSIQYVTCYQDSVSFTRLEYIISNIKFYSKGTMFLYKHSFYLNPKGWNNFTIDSIPCGEYDSLSFSIGDNHPYDSLDININTMIWPMMMGGGFHFLKLEGYYKHNSVPIGFALHTGGNTLQPIYKTLQVHLSIRKTNHTLTLYHNVDKWIDGTICYKVSNSNYSMGVDSLMHIINTNGKDVISFGKFE